MPTCDTRKSFTLFTVYYQTMNADKLGYLLLAKKVDPRCEWIFKCWNLLKFVFLLLHQLVSNLAACTYSLMPEYNLNTELPVVFPNLHICLPYCSSEIATYMNVVLHILQMRLSLSHHEYLHRPRWYLDCLDFYISSLFFCISSVYLCILLRYRNVTPTPLLQVYNMADVALPVLCFNPSKLPSF